LRIRRAATALAAALAACGLWAEAAGTQTQPNFVVGCGVGADTVFADRADAVSACETVRIRRPA